MTTLFDLGVSTPRAPYTNEYRTIVADPPWQPRDELPGPKRGASKHYKTMPTADIRALSHRFPPLAADGLLFLWRLSSMPFDGLDVCRAWGFEPVSEIVWVKVPKGEDVERAHAAMRSACPDGIWTRVMTEDIAQAAFKAARKVRILLGHYVRLSHETCIIAARPGAAACVKRHDIPSVIFAPIGRHSEKPTAFFDLVESLAQGPYLELFARASRGDGWTAIGDQLGTTLDLPLAPSRTA